MRNVKLCSHSFYICNCITVHSSSHFTLSNSQRTFQLPSAFSFSTFWNMSDLICLSQNRPPLLHLNLRHTIKFQQRKKLLSIRGNLITTHFYGLKIQQRWHLINLTQLPVLLILGWNKPVFATGWASSRETDCVAQLTLNSLTQTQFETLFYLPAWFPHCSWETDSQRLSEAKALLKSRAPFINISLSLNCWQVHCVFGEDNIAVLWAA